MSEAFINATLSIPIYIGVAVTSLVIGGLVVGIPTLTSLYPKALEIIDTANVKVKEAPPQSIVYLTKAAADAATGFKILAQGKNGGGGSGGGESGGNSGLQGGLQGNTDMKNLMGSMMPQGKNNSLNIAEQMGNSDSIGNGIEMSKNAARGKLDGISNFSNEGSNMASDFLNQGTNMASNFANQGTNMASNFANQGTNMANRGSVYVGGKKTKNNRKTRSEPKIRKPRTKKCQVTKGNQMYMSFCI
jgi:hypothetical protein